MADVNTNRIYRPGTDLSTLTRWEGGRLPSARLYFFDVDTREELTSHPLNGMVWLSTGAMVVRDGTYCDGTADIVEGVVWCDAGPRRVVVGRDSFPGRRVAAKAWYPNLDADWRALVHGDGTAAPRDGKRTNAWRKAWAA